MAGAEWLRQIDKLRYNILFGLKNGDYFTNFFKNTNLNTNLIDLDSLI